MFEPLGCEATYEPLVSYESRNVAVRKEPEISLNHLSITGGALES